jgi:hypothetical protein
LVDTARIRALEEQLARESAERMREPVEIKTLLQVAADEIRKIFNLNDVYIRLALPDSEGSTDNGS